MPQTITFKRAKIAAESGEKVARTSWIPDLKASYTAKEGWKLGKDSKGYAPWTPSKADEEALDWYLIIN